MKKLESGKKILKTAFWKLKLSSTSSHSGGKTISQLSGHSQDCLLEVEVKLNEFAFWGQNHFAAFWAFSRLKEQELRNIYWIADCITAKRRDPVSMNKWIPILSKQV